MLLYTNCIIEALRTTHYRVYPVVCSASMMQFVYKSILYYNKLYMYQINPKCEMQPHCCTLHPATLPPAAPCHPAT